MKPGAKVGKFTEAQFKRTFYEIYRKHDANQNSTIEFGAEWDNLIRDLMVNFAPNDEAAQEIQKKPRDELRKMFDMADKNKDGIIRFQEI